MRYLPLSSALLALVGTTVADDLGWLGDEFENPAHFLNWQDLGIVEGWHTPSYELADIHSTEPGRFHIVPGANTWFGHLRGLLFFKEVTGDFVATMRVRVLSRHNPGDPTEVPNRSFSLTGIFIHGPRTITQAAPTPYTSDAVWPPQDFGSDYQPNTENYIFLSYGTAGSPGTRQFEIKATRNSDSRLYFAATGIDQSETEAWLQLVRIGDTVVCLRKHSIDGDWIVENRYPNADHPFPDFGETLQVGITAYTDWQTASPFSNGGVETSYHFNYAPPSTGSPDLISQVDYFRLRRPDPSLTESMLQGMLVSYDPSSNSTANPPVLLDESATAAPFLGDQANSAYDPYGNWAVATFGEEAELPLAEPSADADGDGLPNLMEFVLGGDAQSSLSAPWPVGERLDDTFLYTFTPMILDGARIEVHESDDLNQWTSIATRPVQGGAWRIDVEGVAVNQNPSDGQVTVIIPRRLSRSFIRLAAEVPQ